MQKAQTNAKSYECSSTADVTSPGISTFPFISASSSPASSSSSASMIPTFVPDATVVLFGPGYVGEAVCKLVAPITCGFVRITRSALQAQQLCDIGVSAVSFDDQSGVTAALANCTHILSTVAPSLEGEDAILEVYGSDISRAAKLSWIVRKGARGILSYKYIYIRLLTARNRVTYLLRACTETRRAAPLLNCRRLYHSRHRELRDSGRKPIGKRFLTEAGWIY